MAFPQPIQDVLAYRPRHDPSQDCAWSSCVGASQDLRGCPATLRPQEAHGGAAGIASAKAEAGKEVLYSGQAGTRVWVEVSGCCCEVCYTLHKLLGIVNGEVLMLTNVLFVDSRKGEKSRARPTTSARRRHARCSRTRRRTPVSTTRSRPSWRSTATR